jgi:hypothetical protein
MNRTEAELRRIADDILARGPSEDEIDGIFAPLTMDEVHAVCDLVQKEADRRAAELRWLPGSSASAQRDGQRLS